MSRGEAFMKVQDVADELGVSLSRAYRLLARGVIPSIRLAGRIVVPRSAWESWLSDRAAEALTAQGSPRDGQSAPLWIPEVTLGMREHGTNETVTLGRTTAPDVVKLISDRLLADARTSAERVAGDDEVLRALFELDTRKLEQGIEALVAAKAGR